MGKSICALLLLGCLNPLEESTAEKMSPNKKYQPTAGARTCLRGGIWRIHYGKILLISSFQIRSVGKDNKEAEIWESKTT